MFYFDRIVWILHHRMQCQKSDCKKTFASIDPRFLSQLPTRVVERFPFITTIGGAGIHQAMIFNFVNLMTKGLMYGTYTKSINELHNIRYAFDSIGYYDSIADLNKGRETFQIDDKVIEVSTNIINFVLCIIFMLNRS